ncbi:MAG: GntR family transcriptional regulator [Gaiellales bacterium]
MTAASEPLHVRVADTLETAIRRGEYPAGSRLPDERTLARRLEVSRTTLRQALADLSRNGVIRRRVGRGGGTFVRERVVERRSGAAGLTAELARQGMRPGASVVVVSVDPAPPDVAEALALDRGERVVKVVRVRSADGRPVALEESWFPSRRFVGLESAELSGSIYAVLRERYGCVSDRSVERVEARVAVAEDAIRLGARHGSPMIAVERIAFDDLGAPFEFARDRFRGDRTTIVISSREESS